MRRGLINGILFGFLVVGTACGSENAEVAAAVEHQRFEAAQRLLVAGASPDVAQADGMTALLWAVHHENGEMVGRLLRSGASVDQPNKYGVRALSIACRRGNAEILELLLNSGADPNQSLKGGETPLMSAARNGRLQPVKLLLRHGAEIDAVEKKRQTALMWAAAEGHASVVAALIEGGADRSHMLDSGFTAFHFAVREGHHEVAEIFLGAGTDVNTAMRPKQSFGRGVKSGTSALVLAVENGHFELAASLLAAGADPNDQRSGFAPLHMLSWVRKPRRGDGLDGAPPPDGSGSISSLQFARALVEHGADVNLKLKRGKRGRGVLNRTGATPFLLASATADMPLMKVLLELGADPLLGNQDRCNPLMAAAGIGALAPGEEAGTEEEALAAVKLLLELGADVNHVDRNGETAMHGACYKSLPKVALFLAENGAAIEIWNQSNKHGWTPLLIAEGHRPGNFKPSFETISAIHTLMRREGLTPPKPTPRKKRKGYP